jgi:hypothetical protein
MRSVSIKVDGTEVFRLKPGEEKTFTGSGAEQSVRAHLDWTSSQTVRVLDEPERTTVLRVSFPSLPQALLRSFVRPGRALLLEVLPGD